MKSLKLDLPLLFQIEVDFVQIQQSFSIVLIFDLISLWNIYKLLHGINIQKFDALQFLPFFFFFLGKSVRNILPFVNYSKLVDIYLLVCFFYVFMGLVEYAAVGVIDQKWKQKLEVIICTFFEIIFHQV